MIALKENVYLVNGATNVAIYDFNKNYLYSVSKEAKKLLNSVLHKNIEPELNDNEKNYLQELLSKNIIQNGDIPLHTIDELKEKAVVDFVWIELTTACNLKCIHYYDESTCSRTEFLRFEDFRDIINQIEDLGIKKIQLIGGEPFFLGEKLIQYLDYVKEKFEYIEIFTNGTLIDDKWYSYLKENNIRLALSVYSYDEECHDKVTNVLGTWQKTNEVILKIKENGIKYRVRNVIMKDVEIGKKNTNLYELSHKKDIVRMTGRANMNLLSDELLK
ncbi:radical SAM protein [Clostridioides difficile]|uniref:radical SAM protein n=1 Tax=Clostridioides difficile TaxID=1496 RepID=UPI00374ED029